MFLTSVQALHGALCDLSFFFNHRTTDPLFRTTRKVFNICSASIPFWIQTFETTDWNQFQNLVRLQIILGLSQGRSKLSSELVCLAYTGRRLKNRFLATFPTTTTPELASSNSDKITVPLSIKSILSDEHLTVLQQGVFPVVSFMTVFLNPVRNLSHALLMVNLSISYSLALLQVDEVTVSPPVWWDHDFMNVPFGAVFVQIWKLHISLFSSRTQVRLLNVSRIPFACIYNVDNTLFLSVRLVNWRDWLKYHVPLGCVMGSWVYNPCVHNLTHGLCPRGQKPNLTYGFCVQPMGTQINNTW